MWANQGRARRLPPLAPPSESLQRGGTSPSGQQQGTSTGQRLAVFDEEVKVANTSTTTSTTSTPHQPARRF